MACTKSNKMKFKNISRQDLSDSATRIINKAPTRVNDSFYKSDGWKNIQNNYNWGIHLIKVATTCCSLWDNLPCPICYM
mgnify:CR=1 FL=1